MKYKLLIFSVLVTLSGCGSSGESTEYAGNWYNEDADQYYQIADSKSVKIYSCMIHDGYQLDTDLKIEIDRNQFSYKVEGFSDDGTLQRSGDTLTFNFDTAVMRLTEVDGIPSVCMNNAMEIQSVTPLEVQEGEHTNFSVTADYRLASQDSIIIDVGHSYRSDSFRLLEKAYEVTEKGIGTVSFNFDATPKIFADGNSFNIHVVAYDKEDSENESFVILFGDKSPLTILSTEDISGSLDRDCLTCIIDDHLNQ